MSQLMSDQIDQLATALAKAQGEMLVAGKNQKNPFFKSNYADFEAIIAASRPALSKYGLSVVQSPFVCDNGSSFLETILLHSSGQWIKSRAMHQPAKQDVQSLSSYNTYLKRMCYTSLIGVAVGDEDDDGNRASEPSRMEPVRMVTHYQQPPSNIQQIIVEKISKDQLEQLENDLDGHPEIKAKVITALNIERLSDMPRPSFLKALNRIRELAQQEQELKLKTK